MIKKNICKYFLMLGVGRKPLYHSYKTMNFEYFEDVISVKKHHILMRSKSDFL
jgi:hypothetical protein